MSESPNPNAYETTYEVIERILQRPLQDLEPGDTLKLKAPGFMDLSVEVLPVCEETGGFVISLAHYFVSHGDLCQDPEMTVRVFPPGSTAFTHLVPSTDPTRGRAEALTFQQAIPPIYQEVYLQPGRYLLKFRKQLNEFLRFWLGNIQEQGHSS